MEIERSGRTFATVKKPLITPCASASRSRSKAALGQDEAFVLAVAVCIEQMARG